MKIELKESQGLSTIQSLRHLNIKKIHSVHDDFGLELESAHSNSMHEEESKDDPFANMSSADFKFARDKVVPLMRRSTMAPMKTTRAVHANRLSMVAD